MNGIKIYGPGCAKCATLADSTRQAVNELQWNIPVEKVTDPMLFAIAGVLVTPALVAGNKVLISGKVPPVEEIKRLLLEEKGREQSAGQPQAPDKKPGESVCACSDGGACCTGKKQKGAWWKQAVVWVSLVLILLAAVKLINRNTREDRRHTPAAVQNGLEAVYYQYGSRCPTCVRMESWAKETVEESFAEARQSGKLAFLSIPADKDAVLQYGMTTKSLILRKREQGRETGWKNLDRIWDLNGNEHDFKTYVQEEIRTQLNGVK